MSDSNITKQALANSFKNLMAKKPFCKISVRDIVTDCGLTRQAFYYHFKDKYDLMNWIYLTDSARFMIFYNNREHWTEGLMELFHYIRENKTFYMNALNTTGQNSFQEYLYDSIRDLLVSVIRNIEGTEYEEEKCKFVAEFIAAAFVGLTVRWANNGMKEDPVEYIRKTRILFDGNLFRVPF